jgi:hypothetical protein
MVQTIPLNYYLSCRILWKIQSEFRIVINKNMVMNKNCQNKSNDGKRVCPDRQAWNGPEREW